MNSLQRDGVKLCYHETGSGDPAWVLIHGGMADHTHFRPQWERFGPDHRIIVPDLRGHGASDKPDGEYSMAGFAEDVAWLCAELDVTRPVLVGHSMGGLVALAAAAQFPDLPAAIVIMDAPVAPPDWFAQAAGGLVDALATDQYAAALNGFLEQFAGYQDQPENRKRLIAELMANSRHVTVSELTSYVHFDSEAAAGACKVPALYISSGPWLSNIERFRELCPQLLTAQTVGSGHYHQLEVPEQINSMLARFVQLSLSAGAT